MSERFDLFISYAHADGEWVQVLADNLHRLGLEVFIDRWEIRAGDVVQCRLEEGLRQAANGVLVVSPASLASPWVQEEYAAMLTRAVAGRQRLVPVLLAEVDELPPFLATRLWIDFRDADGPVYEQRVRELAAALRGERTARPERDGIIQPPGHWLRPAVIRRRTLVIGSDRVALVGGSGEPFGEPFGEPHHTPAGLRPGSEEAVWQLRRARRRHGGEQPLRATPAEQAPAESALHGAQLAAGAALTRDFLQGAAGTALAAAVAEAEGQGVALELGLQVAEELADLPWETLRLPAGKGLPGPPLVLHPHVRCFRAAGDGEPAPAMTVPGPLRILVAIGSPEEQNRRHDLLDMELELQLIIDAVEPARRSGGAVVRVLPWGTLPAIRQALDGERYHVLHLSCHAAPGRLVLEDDDGGADLVSAERLCAEALPPQRRPPLVVLAGCGTALGVTGDERQGQEALPGLARSLLRRGVPAVVAMQAPVSDRYASLLGARFYQALATMEQPEPLAALARARRDLELERTRDGTADLAEWATPSLHLRGPSLPLYDPWQPFAEVMPVPEPRLAAGVVVRRLGELVGRRKEERLLLRTFSGDQAGLLVHGLGGIGKSSLAAQAVFRLAAKGWLVVSRAGELAPEDLLAEVGRRLLAVARVSPGEQQPLRQLAVLLQRPDLEWPERFELLAEHLLGRVPLLVLLDNFEDNLGEPDANGERTCTNEQLAELLATWLRQPGESRLLLTSRYPFVLPQRAHRRLPRLHLGPLTFAETRKLLWRLPGLDRLSTADKLRAYTDVGGHPRALEYLDALLRGGEARFADVADRLEQALAQRGISRPQRWLQAAGGDLDRALAETVTLAADDVLLDSLLAGLGQEALARDLLLGAAVYRVPVGDLGLAWQVGREVELPQDPKLEQRWQELQAASAKARQAGEPAPPDELGFSAAETAELMAYHTRPPIAVPDGLDEARDRLLGLGLLAPDEPGYLVHRWTATALARRSSPQQVQQAHHRAARFWSWRVERLPQSREQDIGQLLEARHHHHEAGELEAAVQVTEWICSQLHTWCAYGRERQLCQEVLTWVSPRSRHAAVFSHGLGMVAQKRGDYDGALEWYRRSLEIKEELGNRAGMAGSYHQLGIVAQERGDYDGALEWYRRSLEIEEELGNRAGMAISYHQLGMVAQERGDYDGALEWYRRSLEIKEELGNRAGMASSYHNLGAVAQERGDYDGALEWYRRSLEIEEELGNRAGIAASYHQLGMVAQERGDSDGALEWYRRSLEIKEELGNRAGMASSYHQLGRVAQERGDSDGALEWYRRSLEILEEIGNRAGMAISYHQLGIVAQERGDPDGALEWYRRSLEILEEIGNRAGMASTKGQMAVLLTERGDAEAAVPLTLESLAIHREIGAPQARIDLHWLRRQRELLGPRRFEELVRQHTGEEAAEILQLLDSE